MTIDALRERATGIACDLPRIEQAAAIERLFLQYAQPLAKAVEALNEPLARSEHTPEGALRHYTECPECWGELPSHEEHCPVVPALAQAREVQETLAPKAPIDLTLANGWKCYIRRVQDTWLCFAEPGDGSQVYLCHDGLWHESLGQDNYGWPDATTILGVLRRSGHVAEARDVLAARKDE